MLNDVEAGRPLEVEGLLGVVVELAEKLGEPVPASSTVYALARGLNRRSVTAARSTSPRDRSCPDPRSEQRSGLRPGARRS